MIYPETDKPGVASSPTPAPNLRDLCYRHGIRFKKSLGQNLLLDDNINRIMVDAAGLTAQECVVEVGAGLGALTRRLRLVAGKVVAVEIDASFMPCLEEQFAEVDNVCLFRGDILNHDLSSLLESLAPGETSFKMVSNLPYYITTPVLFHFLESSVTFSRLVVMLQEEVGQRLVATVDTPEYGVLTIAASLYADVDIVHRVPATCFLPQPKVNSCVVRFRRHPKPLASPSEMRFLMSVVRAAFSQRRKTLRNSLTKSGSFGAPREAVLDAFGAAQIDPGRRPQTLDPVEFMALASEIRSRL